MATLKSVIDMVDEIKPNAFSNEAKTQWLNECEGLVQTEVLLFASEEIITYHYDADKDKELLAQPPHDKIYWAYLTAMIDFANGEYNKYQNTMQVFNSFFSEFMRWFALNYHPADTHMEELHEDRNRVARVLHHGLWHRREARLHRNRGRVAGQSEGRRRRAGRHPVQRDRRAAAVEV